MLVACVLSLSFKPESQNVPQSQRREGSGSIYYCDLATFAFEEMTSNSMIRDLGSTSVDMYEVVNSPDYPPGNKLRCT